MKFFLILILFSLFVLVSIIVYLYYLYRNKLFTDLDYIVKSLKNNICFSKDNVNTLITKAFDGISATSKFLLQNHNNVFSKIISKEDKSFINEFFSSLGKGDVDYEINNLEFYGNKFNELKTSTKEDLKSKGIMYLKLIIGIGLIVCIVII